MSEQEISRGGRPHWRRGGAPHQQAAAASSGLLWEVARRQRRIAAAGEAAAWHYAADSARSFSSCAWYRKALLCSATSFTRSSRLQALTKREGVSQGRRK